MKKRPLKSKVFNSLNIILIGLLFVEIILVGNWIATGNPVRTGWNGGSTFEIDNNTVALWHFDEGVGNSVLDETPNDNDGTIIGGTLWTDDSFSGSALNFDGVNDKIQIIKTPSVDVITNLTLEAYIKRTSNNNGMIISKNGPYFLAIRNNVVMGGIYSNDGVPGSNSWTEVHGTTFLSQDTWYYIKLTYDGNNISVYLDDRLENSVPKIGQMPQVSQQVNIGWGDPGHDQYFAGIIDEVRISNTTRLPAYGCGDLNKDGVRDVLDVVGIVNIAFRGYPPPAPAWVADINGDGTISDVLDVVGLINHVFRGGVEPTCSQTPIATSSSATASFGAVSGTTTKIIPVNFANTESVAGTTFKLTYDPLKLYIKNIRTASRTSNMQLIRNGNSFALIDQNGVNNIIKGSGAIAYIDVTAGKAGFDTSSLKITEVKAANPKANKIAVKIGTSSTGVKSGVSLS